MFELIGWFLIFSARSSFVCWFAEDFEFDADSFNDYPLSKSAVFTWQSVDNAVLLCGINFHNYIL